MAINAKNTWIDFQTRPTIGCADQNQLAAGPLDALALLATIWSAVVGVNLARARSGPGSQRRRAPESSLRRDIPSAEAVGA